MDSIKQKYKGVREEGIRNKVSSVREEGIRNKVVRYRDPRKTPNSQLPRNSPVFPTTYPSLVVSSPHSPQA